MRTECSAYVDAIDHLPPGTMLVVPGVSWEQYEDLLEDLGGRPGTRVSFDEGRLEFLELNKTHGQTEAIKIFRRRIQTG